MTFSRLFPVLALVFGIVAWPISVRAQRIVLNPYEKQVNEQEEDNKRWESEAKSEEKDLLKIADTYYKEKDYRRAREYYEKVVDIRYRQWDFPPKSGAQQFPARDKDTFKLDSAGRRRAESRLERMTDTINEETLKSLSEQAEVLQMMEEYGRAYRAYDALIAEAEKMGVKRYAATYIKRARSGQEKILKPADALLDDVEKLIQKEKADEAAEKLREVEESYASLLKLSPQLFKRYTSLGGVPVLADEAREKEAASKLRLGDAAMARKDYSTAYQTYTTLSTTYDDTEAGLEAKRRLARMLADPSVREAMKEQEAEAACRLLLARAGAFYNADRLAEARAACEEIVINHPDTKWAKDAVELLDLIEKKEASSGAN